MVTQASDFFCNFVFELKHWILLITFMVFLMFSNQFVPGFVIILKNQKTFNAL